MKEMAFATKAFIKDEDINIEHIRRRLKRIAGALRENNRMNLTDINIICEEIFGEILNRIYGLELISTSAEISGNFIAVDLVDYKRRTAFQVTSRTDKRKIDDTIRKFEKSELSDQIDSLHFLLLNMKKFPEETFKNYEQKSFWKPENILNLEDLSEQIAGCSHDLMVDIYDLITMVYDSGRLTYSNIMENTRSLSFDEQLEDDYFSVWKQGYGDIQITAFLPVNYEQELSCLLEIRKYDVAGAFITLGQEKLLKDYFVDEKKFTDIHNVGRWADDEQMWMQIENIRLNVNAHTAYHIYQLFSNLQEAYHHATEKISETLGAKGLKRADDRYYLGEVTIQQWHNVCLFAHAGGHFSTENGWELVLPSSGNTRLVVSSTGNQNTADVLAELSVKHHDYRENVLEVFWKPGYSAAEANCMEGFDNKFKWKADYTQKWFYGWLLPKASEFTLATRKKSGKKESGRNFKITTEINGLKFLTQILQKIRADLF